MVGEVGAVEGEVGEFCGGGGESGFGVEEAGEGADGGFALGEDVFELLFRVELFGGGFGGRVGGEGGVAVEKVFGLRRGGYV